MARIYALSVLNLNYVINGRDHHTLPCQDKVTVLVGIQVAS